MATDPKAAQSVFEYPTKEVGRLGEMWHEVLREPMNSIERQRAEQMIRDKEITIRDKKVHDKLDDLLDGFSVISETDYRTMAGTLGEVLRSKIEHHKHIIKTLEWFAAHVGIDNPEDENLLVSRVILEGLNTLTTKRR
jgi:hypothetical protein